MGYISGNYDENDLFRNGSFFGSPETRIFYISFSSSKIPISKLTKHLLKLQEHLQFEFLNIRTVQTEIKMNQFRSFVHQLKTDYYLETENYLRSMEGLMDHRLTTSFVNLDQLEVAYQEIMASARKQDLHPPTEAYLQTIHRRTCTFSFVMQ